MEIEEITKKDQMTREEYFATDAISRSLLVELRKHPLLAKRMIEEGMNETSDALRLGDAFDVMMFDHRNIFNEKFHVMSSYNPCTNGATNLGKFMNKCMEHTNGEYDKEELYKYCYEESGIKNPKFELFIKSFKEIGGERYLDDVIAGNDKIILTKDEYENLVLMQRILQSDSNFGKYFVVDLVEGQNRYKISEHEEVIYQLVILWNDCKVMLDVLYINHKTKYIRPIDLKTTSVKNHDVESTIVKYDYVYQGGMYHLGACHWRDQNYPDYIIDNFSFIFSEKSITFAPIEMQLSDTDLNASIHGGIDRLGNYQLGILDLIDALKWHQTNDKWDYRLGAYMTNGCITSNIFQSFSHEDQQSYQ